MSSSSSEVEKAQPVDSPGDARARRIAAAVERSKKEYKPEHAVTEREWFVNAEAGPGSNKKDRQRLEYVATHHLLTDYGSSSPAAIVAEIMACGKLSNLSRELLATGTQAAIQAGDADSALLFARAAKSYWRSYPSLAVLAAQALNFAGQTKEATHPLLESTGTALHYPVLMALANSLHCIGEVELTNIISNLAESRQWAFDGDLFSKDRKTRGSLPTMKAADVAHVDREALAKRLGVARSLLDKAMDRVTNAFGGGDDEPTELAPGVRDDRGVIPANLRKNKPETESSTEKQASLAPAPETSTYIVPTKHILSRAHLDAFLRSPAHDQILGFVDALNDSIVGKKLSEAGKGSERTRPILAMLDSVLEIAKATPPVDNKLSRFGNPAFKTFYDRVAEASSQLHASIPGLDPEAVKEVEVYFRESWGNRERVDYGSGMELNFLCWLLCLRKLSVVAEEDYPFLVLGIFWRYILVMRYLQSTYWLEPAGSHGVWGLDDYQFLPFLWGAGQLKTHKHLRPKAIHDREILDAFASEYMYLSCIDFINSIKTASLRWHSPMLDDISAVKTWDKVNSGMRKMYAAEVLGKLPVMQHALFGSLIRFPTPEEDPELAKALAEDGEAHVDSHGHVHDEKGWSMDCCGIPVPSAFGEAQASAAPVFSARPGLKPIPFD